MAGARHAKGVRRTYSKGWQRLLDGAPLERKHLQMIGRILVEEVVRQARADAAKARGLKAGNMLPKDPAFYRSFGFRIVGDKTVELMSTWPWIEDLTKGRKPFPMDWLRRDKGEFKAVPVASKGGKPIFRMVPLQTDKAWIHPGIAKHNFIQKAMKNARPRVVQVYVEAMLDA